MLKEWCQNQKLDLSAKKSHMILFKGFLDIKRPPTVRLGSKAFKMVPEIRDIWECISVSEWELPHTSTLSVKNQKAFLVN